jgi:hypothetical protein
VAIGYALFGIALAGWLWFWMGRENARRERGERKAGGVGDRDPAYRFQL